MAATETSASANPAGERAQPSASLDAVARLEAQLRQTGRRRWGTRLAWMLGLCVLLAAGALWRRSQTPPPEPRFRTKALEVRDVLERVESTGRLRPLTEVQVGAQVSGRVARVHVDFNAQVKRGDLLAEIDPQLFGAQVGQVTGQLEAAKAALSSAQARATAAEAELKRVTELVQESIATRAELDKAIGTRDVALADIAAANASITGLRAQLKSVQTTLTYTKIYSPIDGIVINRAVEPGQTLAASFNSPTLFLIAQDLSQMEVLADIDEADVGKVKEQMPALVTVDAFAGESFVGKVTQIRYNPNEVQGIVTYSAVIDVKNQELKLRPGMTATVSITTREVKHVLAAPNAALRFKPQDKDRGPELTSLGQGQGRVYQLSGGVIGKEQIAPLVVGLGASDGIWTELTASGLDAGSQLVVEQTDKPEARRLFGIF
jgi:HlyD family secretion protein